MATATPPSPLPFVVSILPILFSSSGVNLPPDTLSASVLQRHYFLSVTPASVHPYLQATSDETVQQAVEERRESLASRWLEEIRLSKQGEIQYSRSIHEEQMLVAKVMIAPDSEEQALALLVVFEQVADEQNGEEEQGITNTESSWRYYDLQLPRSRSNMNTAAWHASIAAAEATVSGNSNTPPANTSHQRKASVSHNNGYGQTHGTSVPIENDVCYAREKERQRRIAQEEPEKGLQGEEGAEQDPDDFWGGYESSNDGMEDDQSRINEHAAQQQAAEDEDESYWNAYGSKAEDQIGEADEQEAAERQNHPIAEEESEHTMKFTNGFGSHQQHQDYSFESEQGGVGETEDSGYPFTTHRILANGHDLPPQVQDSFLTSLHSSLEKISSSQSDSSFDEDDGAHGRSLTNGHKEWRGKVKSRNSAAHLNGYSAMEESMKKSIAGLWELYRLSSGDSRTGKNREVAAFEFMELVRGVVEDEGEASR